MQCEMCGADTELFKVDVEGAVMEVCSKCSRFGKVIEKIRPPAPAPSKQQLKMVETRKKIETETIFMISSDYSSLIKAGREKLGLKQEELAKKLNEKEGLIHKLETGEMIPSIPLARKLEKFFNIKIVEEHKEEPTDLPKAKDGEVTLGDFVKIKKR